MVFEDFFPTLPIDQQSPFVSFVFPFLLIFALFFGTLSLVRVFNKRISALLALIFTLVTTQTPAFSWFASILPAYGAIAATSIFVIIFVFGFIRWGLYRGRDIYEEHGGSSHRLDRLTKEREKVWKKYKEARDRKDEAAARALFKRLEELDEEVQYESTK